MNQISNFTKRFNEMLSTLNISQQRVADRTGLNKSIIHRYVYGNCMPKTETLNTIAKAFNVSPIWLMGYDVSMYLELDRVESEHNIYFDKLNKVNKDLDESQRKQVLKMIEVMFPGIEQ